MNFFKLASSLFDSAICYQVPEPATLGSHIYIYKKLAK